MTPQSNPNDWRSSDLLSNDWRRLAEQASAEPDPAKLLTIVEVLNRVLDREATFRHAYRKGASA